jgi:hypothetical protein
MPLEEIFLSYVPLFEIFLLLYAIPFLTGFFFYLWMVSFPPLLLWALKAAFIASIYIWANFYGDIGYSDEQFLLLVHYKFNTNYGLKFHINLTHLIF